MPVEVRCPNCAKDFRLKDELAGRTVRCQCGQAFIVPELEPEVIEPESSLLELLDDADREAASQLDALSRQAGSNVELIGTQTNEGLELELAQRLCAGAEQDIARVFGSGANNCRLKIVSEAFNQDLTGVHLRYKIAGQLNGRAVKKTINRAMKSALASGVQHGIGGVVGAAVVFGAAAAFGSGSGQRATKRFDQCFQLCQADLRMFIEEQAPRSASAHVDRFWLAKQISIAFGVVSIPISAAVLCAQGDKGNWTAALLLGAVAGGMFGMAAYALAVALMPTSEFVNSPRGRWVTRSDPSRISKVRAGYMAMSIMAALWAIGVVALPKIGKEFRERFPPAAGQQGAPRRVGP